MLNLEMPQVVGVKDEKNNETTVSLNSISPTKSLACYFKTCFIIPLYKLVTSFWPSIFCIYYE